MANIIRKVLNANGMTLELACAATSRIGFGITGTWTGSVAFRISYDGVTYFPLTVTPFASGVGVQSTTGNGNFEALTKNAATVQVVFTLTTGSANVAIGASTDASYQDVFLTSTSQFVTQEASGGGTNILTIAAQANRAWRCRTLNVSFSVAPGAAVKLTIADGGSANIWVVYVPATAGYNTIPLPADWNTPATSGGGIVNTPGNSMVFTLAAPGGSVVSEINAEMIPA